MIGAVALAVSAVAAVRCASYGIRAAREKNFPGAIAAVLLAAASVLCTFFQAY